jgi:hypothetical protein
MKRTTKVDVVIPQDKLVAMAKEVVASTSLPSGARIVVAITDVWGDWVAVASSAPHEDATNILRCALKGAERKS